MNCDTAFDLMTDPHGSRSGALAEHFGTCPRCRRMQETLAPALEFLADEPAMNWADNESIHAAARGQLFVAAEAVQLARQAATSLATRAELPRVRALRMAARCAKYAAAFAAGLLLAVILFSQRDGNVAPPGTCTRREASSDTSRTPAQIRALAQSCAVCHQTSLPDSNDHSAIRPVRNTGSWDWLIPILEAQPQSDIESPGFESGQMIAATTERALLFSNQA